MDFYSKKTSKKLKVIKKKFHFEILFKYLKLTKYVKYIFQSDEKFYSVNRRNIIRGLYNSYLNSFGIGISINDKSKKNSVQNSILFRLVNINKICIDIENYHGDYDNLIYYFDKMLKNVKYLDVLKLKTYKSVNEIHIYIDDYVGKYNELKLYIDRMFKSVKCLDSQYHPVNDDLDLLGFNNSIMHKSKETYCYFHKIQIIFESNKYAIERIIKKINKKKNGDIYCNCNFVFERIQKCIF